MYAIRTYLLSKDDVVFEKSAGKGSGFQLFVEFWRLVGSRRFSFCVSFFGI